MYNSELEHLIDMALVDGELSAKEKQVLYKKAETMGVDLDEFEMVLEARLHQKQQAVKDKANRAQVSPRSDKLGDVRKCPACGSIVESFSTKCTDCGHEFRDIEASKNITKFFDKLDEVEATRKEPLFEKKEQKVNMSLGTLLKWVFFYPILIPLKILNFLINKSKPSKWSTVDARKEDMIMNFPVPNSREEIIEFVSLSASRIKGVNILKRFDEEGKYIRRWNSIWKKKTKQVFSKAKLSMGNDKATIESIEQMLIEAKILKKK